MLIRWVPVVIWIAVILGLSSIPGNSHTEPLFPGFDKLAHMGVYGVLGLLFARARALPGQSPWRIALWSAMFGLVMGSSDEWYQRSVAGRISDVFDVGADVLGAALGDAMGGQTALHVGQRAGLSGWSASGPGRRIQGPA